MENLGFTVFWVIFALKARKLPDLSGRQIRHLSCEITQILIELNTPVWAKPRQTGVFIFTSKLLTYWPKEVGYSNFFRGIHLRSITIGIVVSRQLYAFCHNIAEIITAMNSPKSAFFIYSCYHYSDKYFVRIMIALHADIVLSY